jgi:undecaprenyl pyrophosphate phosphatase UppP
MVGTARKNENSAAALRVSFWVSPPIIVAILAMRSLVNFLTRHGFKIFGLYRVFVGAIILILLALGIDLEVM